MMTSIRQLLLRLLSLFRHERAEDELTREVVALPAGRHFTAAAVVAVRLITAPDDRVPPGVSIGGARPWWSEGGCPRQAGKEQKAGLQRSPRVIS